MPLFMLLMGGSHEMESRPTPKEDLEKFGERAAKLATEGKLIWADLLKPTSHGARVIVDASGSTRIEHGPFEGGITGAYAVFNCADLNEVIGIVESVPGKMPNIGVEIRPIMGFSDFGELAGEMTEEQKGHVLMMRELMKKNGEVIRA